MSKRLPALLIAVMFTVSTTTAFAASDDLWEGMMSKFKRGLVNVLTGWVEFPVQMMKGYKEGFMGDENNKIIGVAAGVCDGVCHAVGRTIHGAIELAGFWAADPESNEEIGLPLDGEYAWDEGVSYDLFDPSFQKATIDPIGKKLVRGISNALLGFVEIPSQLTKGVKGKAMDIGIGKGIWYLLSREVAGASDIATALVPTPKDTKGLAFDEEWPWDALSENIK